MATPKCHAREPRYGLAARPDLVRRSVRLPNGTDAVDSYALNDRFEGRQWPDGTWLRFRYDIAGHVREMEHSSGERIEFAVDADQRLWNTRTSRTETSVRFGADGRPSMLIQVVDGHMWSVEYEWNGSTTATMRYPGAESPL